MKQVDETGIELHLFDQQYLKFKTLESAKDFFTKELELWNDFVKLQTTASGNYPEKRGRSFWNSIANEVIQQQVNPLIILNGQIQTATTLADAEGSLKSFQSVTVILSNSSKGEKILEDVQSNPLHALLLLSHWHPNFIAEGNLSAVLQQPPPPPSSKFFNSALVTAKAEALIYEKGIKGVAKVERESLQKIKNETQDMLAILAEQLEKYHGKVLEADNFYTETAEKADSFYLQTTEKFKSLIERKKKFSKNLIREQIEEFTKLRKQYTEELALKIPVTYWKDKANQHQVAAYLWGFVFLVSVGLIIYFSPVLLDRFINSIKVVFTDLEKNQWSLFFVITFPAFLTVWVLRIVSRNIMTNFNHMHDSRNRAVMTETFLALMSEDKAKENDRILILNALFQPINVHSIEDSAPPHWFELMMERTKK